MLTKVVVFVFGPDEEEEFLVLTEHSPDALELMKERRDRLQRGEPVRAQLDRQPQAFRASANAQHFELPPEFYNLTAEELKKEQQQRYYFNTSACDIGCLCCQYVFLKIYTTDVLTKKCRHKNTAL